MRLSNGLHWCFLQGTSNARRSISYTHGISGFGVDSLLLQVPIESRKRNSDFSFSGEMLSSENGEPLQPPFAMVT